MLRGYGLAESSVCHADQIEGIHHLDNTRKNLGEQCLDLAVTELEAIIALDPTKQDAQGNLGMLLFFRGEIARADPHLRIAVNAQPDLWKLQALLGLAEVKLKWARASFSIAR